MKDQLTKDIAELLILAPYPSISEYEPIKHLRLNNTDSNLIVIKGE